MTKIFVSCVPPELNELVKVYIESERQGGGQFNSYEYDEIRQCVTVEFVDETVCERMIQKKFLLLLSHEMPIMKADSEATIFVYDIPTNYIDDLECILESQRRGGGPILSQDFLEEFSCLKVTFEDEKVALHFANNGVLKVASERLPVSRLPPRIFRPQYKYYLVPDIIRKEMFTEESSSSLLHRNDSNLSGYSTLSPKVDFGEFESDGSFEELTLEAFNLPKGLKTEQLKLVLESKRFDGNTLKFFEFDDERRVARFSYVDEKVARGILTKEKISISRDLTISVRESRSATLNDQILRFGSFDPFDAKEKDGGLESQYCTVELKSKANLIKDTLLLYVESKRSKGGPTRDIIEINPRTFIITFVSAKDAKSFCSHDHSGYFKGETSTVMLDSWPEGIKPCGILIEGFSNSTTIDMMRMFFENPRSGGRPDSVEQAYVVREGVACLVFNDSDVVDSILLKNNWNLGQQQLNVTVCKPSRPPPLLDPLVKVDPKWLMFTGINIPSLSHKVFKEFLSFATQACVDYVHYFKESQKALVQFVDEPDFEHILKTLCSRPCQGSMISVERVPIVDSILVECKEYITSEMLKLYFENARSGGGTTRDVRQLSEPNSWIVQFMDEQIIDRVMKRQHSYGKFNFSVRPYVQC